MSLARRTLQIVALICTLLIGAASMAVVVAQTAWFKEWLRRLIVRQAEEYVNGELTIGRLDGNLLFGIEMENVGVTMDGKTVVAIKDVGLDYNVFTFVTGDVVLDDIRLNQPVFRVERTAEGWNIMRLIRARTPDTPRGRPIEVSEIGISDGAVYMEGGPVGTAGVTVPERIERLDASIGVRSDEHALTVDIGHLSLRAREPNIGINALSGVIRRAAEGITLDDVSLRTEESSLRLDAVISTPGDGSRAIDLAASSDRFVLEEIARVVPLLRGYEMQPAFELTASGPFDRLSVDLDARDEELGHVTSMLTADVTAPDRRLTGSASMVNLDIAPIVRGAAPAGRPEAITSDVTGQAQFDLTLPSGDAPLRGTYRIAAGRARVAGYDARNVVASGRIDGRIVRVDGVASAYGGRATAAGTVTLGQPVTLDLAGRAAGVDLRNLPADLGVPAVPSDLQFTYTLRAQAGVYSGDASFDASTFVGAAVAPGTTAQFRFGGGSPAYAAQGEAAGIDVEQIGRAFGIEALATDRFSSRLNGTFDVTGAGGGRYPLVLDAAGTLVDSELFGATVPQLGVAARLSNGDAVVHAVGQFSGVDPAVVALDQRVAGRLDGTLDVDATIRDYAAGLTIDSFDASGRVDLTESRVADLAITSAAIEGEYANREGRLTRLDLVSPDLTVNAQGAIALNDTGSSSLSAHIEARSLELIGAMIGRPLRGAAVVDATITGNARELRAEGTLEGSNVGYGENRVLDLDTAFAVTMPDLAPADVAIQAKSTATFVEIGGQTIAQVVADTTYADSTLEFSGIAQEGGRQVEAEGSAILHPDHQEVHLTDLVLHTEQIEWRKAEGASAAIRYGGDRIHIEGLQLVSGDQRVEAEGVLGSPDGTLRVRAENVDVAQLDRLLLGEERVAGRLDATAVLTGPLDAPRAEGEFVLREGAFRQFMFESLGGTVESAGPGLNVDVRLQESPEAWITATGYAPLSLFRPSPPGVEGHETPAAGEMVDLQISSSQIDLGLIQGFTSYVTDVTGMLQANVNVTGTGHDPHLEGVVVVRDGAFAVPDLGTAYTGLDTTLDFTSDALTISEMRIVDEHRQVMTIGGTLGVHERAVGAVDVRIQSENFEVIDNELADLKLDADLRVTGELRAPRVEGFVEVESGTIDVARVVERATANLYATEAVVLDARDLEGELPALVAPQPRLLDAIDLTVGVAVPSNLVLRGTDFRPANAPIDLGDINVTVGGAVQVRKAPGERPRLIGEVNTVRGSYTFQGRRFEILRDGRIRFAGTDEIDPLIDLRARRIISGVETFIRVHGTMRQPELAFSSRPPLDQADILSLIVFNMPINELGERQQVSLAERAGALAGGYLVSGLTRSIATALELDEFEIQAQGDRGFGPMLSIGEQVGERLFFRIRQGFGANEATEFILEYQIADFLRLQGAVAETTGGTQRISFRRVERGGIDLIFFFSY